MQGTQILQIKAYLGPCQISIIKSSHPEVFLRKDVLKICSKFTGEHPCRSVVLIKLLCNFIEIALRYRCSPVNLLHIFRTPFAKNTSGGLLLYHEAFCEYIRLSTNYFAK